MVWYLLLRELVWGWGMKDRRLVINPFVSEAQRRACYARDDPDWDCKEWSDATKEHGKKLPDRKSQTHNARTVAIGAAKKSLRKNRKTSGSGAPNPLARSAGSRKATAQFIQGALAAYDEHRVHPTLYSQSTVDHASSLRLSGAREEFLRSLLADGAVQHRIMILGSVPANRAYAEGFMLATIHLTPMALALSPVTHSNPDQPRDDAGRWTSSDKTVADEIKAAHPLPQGSYSGLTPAQKSSQTAEAYRSYAATAIHKAAHGNLEEVPRIPPTGAPLKKLQSAFDTAANGLTSLHLRKDTMSKKQAEEVADSHPQGRALLDKSHEALDRRADDMARAVETLADRLHEEYSRAGLGSSPRTQLTPDNFKLARLVDLSTVPPGAETAASKLISLIPRSDVLATGDKRVIFPDKASKIILKHLAALGSEPEKLSDKADELWHSSGASEQAPVTQIPEYLKGHTVSTDKDRSLEDADRYKRISRTYYLRMRADEGLPRFVTADKVPPVIGAKEPHS